MMDLRQKVEHREGLIKDIDDLIIEKKKFEHEIKKYMIEKGMVDFLTVNWNRLSRISHKL